MLPTRMLVGCLHKLFANAAVLQMRGYGEHA
jgi:hypothetical protein